MKAADRIDNLRIASPCPAAWENMGGDDRVRFCDQCSLHVYNISELTRTEAQRLIANTEGRICARMFRRADGTVITKDCPVGLRAIRRRIAKVAGAAFAVGLSLCSNVFAAAREGKRSGLLSHSVDLNLQTNRAILEGRVLDPSGAPLPDATVTLINSQTNQKHVMKSDKKGRYRFVVFNFGEYSLACDSSSFPPFVQTIMLDAGDDTEFNISLTLGGLVGVVVIDAPRRTGFDVNGIHVRINQEER